MKDKAAAVAGGAFSVGLSSDAYGSGTEGPILDPAQDEGASLWFQIYLRRLERQRREKEKANNG